MDVVVDVPAMSTESVNVANTSYAKWILADKCIFQATVGSYISVASHKFENYFALMHSLQFAETKSLQSKTIDHFWSLIFH